MTTQAFAIPSYQRVAETLRARVRDGVYLTGEHIPAAVELEKSFQVSNITIRKALELLAREGWIASRRGVGTVVLDPPSSELVDIRISGNFTDWLDTASAKDYEIDQRVIAVDTLRCPPRIQQILEVEPRSDIWRMRRIRFMYNVPMSYHVNFGRKNLTDVIDAEDLQGSGNFASLLRQRYPEPLGRLDQHVEAAAANMDIAELLKVDFGAPIFFVENVYRTFSDSAAAVSHLYLRADRYCYSASIDFDIQRQISDQKP